MLRYLARRIYMYIYIPVYVYITVSVAKITVHIVKCAGAHRNFSCATSNYSNVVFCVYAIINISFLLSHHIWSM